MVEYITCSLLADIIPIGFDYVITKEDHMSRDGGGEGREARPSICHWYLPIIYEQTVNQYLWVVG